MRDEADARGLTVFDATRPLVTKVHVEVAAGMRRAYEFMMIGHGPPEVEGTMGRFDARRYRTCRGVADVARLQLRKTDKLGGGDADHVVGGRRGRDHPAEVRVYLAIAARAQEAGHLLRHAEPPGRREGAGAARWTW